MTKKEIIYIIALFFEVVAMMISITTIPYMVNEKNYTIMLKILRYTGYLLVFIKILLDKYKIKKILLICAVAVALCINSIFIGNTVMCMSLFVFGMIGIDFDKLARIILPWFIVGTLITIVGSQIGIIDNWLYTVSGRSRYALGYFYPSHATSVILYVVLLVCYVKKEKLQLYHVILIEIINLWQWKQTDSKTGSALIALIPIVFFALKYWKKDFSKTLIGLLLKMIFPLCAILSLTFSYLYKSFSFMEYINAFLSNRLVMGYNALKMYGIHFWGQSIAWVGYGGLGFTVNQLEGNYNFVDCSYVKILLENGFAVWLFVMAGFTYASIYAVKNQQIYMATALFFVAGYSVIEPRLIEIGFNPFVVLLALALNQKQNLEIKKEIFVYGKTYG